MKNGLVISGNNKVWYKNDKRHRDEKDSITRLTLPALECIFGCGLWYKEWIKEGETHRDDIDVSTGLILHAIEESNGTKRWFKKGKCHRDDKDPATGLTLPALEWDGKKEWWINGIEQKEYTSKLQSTILNTIPLDCCSICLESMNIGDYVVILHRKSIQHVYHFNCLKEYSKYEKISNGKIKCPTCRQSSIVYI